MTDEDEDEEAQIDKKWIKRRQCSLAATAGDLPMRLPNVQ